MYVCELKDFHIHFAHIDRYKAGLLTFIRKGICKSINRADVIIRGRAPCTRFISCSGEPVSIFNCHVHDFTSAESKELASAVANDISFLQKLSQK